MIILFGSIKELVDQNKAIMICPEVLGGLTIPRAPCEIVGDKVINNLGEDKTTDVSSGAKRALKILLENDVKVVLLKSKL